MSDFDIDAWTDSVENGDIALTELDEVPGGGDDRDRHAANLLEPHAAANMGLLLAAAKDAGMALAIHYSYRDLPTQRVKWKAWKAYEAFSKGIGPPADKANLAAEPGHSNHGWALAVDFDIDVKSDLRFEWLRNNALSYGFHWNDADSEPWHWDYEGGGPGEVDDMTPEEKKVVAEARKFLEMLQAEIETPSPQAAAKAVARAVKKTHSHRDDGSPQA